MQSGQSSELESYLGDAMRKAVRHVLEQVAQHGLPGDYHLFVTFATGHPGVAISNPVAEQYPEEMTIVLQHMFWDLVVGSEAFEVTLSFSGQSERLTIPFGAITGFTDNISAFRIMPRETETRQQELPTEAGDSLESQVEEDSKVVSLDSLRKRKN